MVVRSLVRFLFSFLFALLWSASGFATELNPILQPTSLQVRADLDGDQVPDTARISGLDNDYVVSISLSSRQLSTRLHTYHTSGPVIAVEAIDVDGDHDRDIVLLGLNSFKPSGLWLNEGSKGFRSQRPWLAANFEKQSGAELTLFTSEYVNTDPDSMDEPGPDAVVPHYFLPSIVTIEIPVFQEPEDVVFSRNSSNVPLRGPPTSL